MKDVELMVEEVSRQAVAENKNIDFDFWAENDSPENGFAHSRVGTALSCGCIIFCTILTDGSIGQGSWTDWCSVECMNS